MSGMSVRLAFARSFSMIRFVMICSFISISRTRSHCSCGHYLGQQFLIFVAQLAPIQQVRAVAQRFFQRGATAPAAYFFVIARNQHFGHRHPAKFHRPRVVRIIQQSTRSAGRIGTTPGCHFRLDANDSCREEAAFPKAPGISRVTASTITAAPNSPPLRT